MSHDGNPHPNARQVEKGGEAVPEVVIRMRAIALRLGWSIGIHGSMARDYDMIAVPWSKEAAPWRADYVSTYAVELCGLQGGIWLKYEAYSLTTLAEVRKKIGPFRSRSAIKQDEYTHIRYWTSDDDHNSTVVTFHDLLRDWVRVKEDGSEWPCGVEVTE